jgi:hypothetical protein
MQGPIRKWFLCEATNEFFLKECRAQHVFNDLMIYAEHWVKEKTGRISKFLCISELDCATPGVGSFSKANSTCGSPNVPLRSVPVQAQSH